MTVCLKSARLIALCVYLIFLSGPTFGQIYPKEASNWIFGNNAYLRFGTNGPTRTPVAINGNVKGYAAEGMAAMSDTAGNLLFYVGSKSIPSGTDSLLNAVFDKNNNIMPNGDGLFGGSSSTQNALIVRQPGSFSKYYIFTTSQEEKRSSSAQGFRYSVVDMTLNGGLGAVLAEKNKVLISETDEKVSAVMHADGRRVWVMARKRGTNEFHAFLVSENGVTDSVLSAVGQSTYRFILQEKSPVVRGAMKFSPNGHYLAMAFSEPIDGAWRSQICRFNTSTGVVSDPIIFSITDNVSSSPAPYGVEFSPDNTKLYISNRFRSVIYQFNLCAGGGSAAGILDSRVNIPTSNQPAALQVAQDGRIYVAMISSTGTSSRLGVIQNPNRAGAQCGFVENGFQFSLNARVYRGLPTFNQSYFNTGGVAGAFSYSKLCQGAATQFVANLACANSPTPPRFFWRFADPATGTADTSTLPTPTHLFSAAGVYNVFFKVTIGTQSDSITLPVDITAKPSGVIEGDSLSCKTTASYMYKQTGTQIPLPSIKNYSWTLRGVSSAVGTPTYNTSFNGPTNSQIQFAYDSNQTVLVKAIAYAFSAQGEQCPSDTAYLKVIVNQRRGATPIGADTTCLVLGKPITITSPDAPRNKYAWTITPFSSLDSLTIQSNTALAYFKSPGAKTAYVAAHKDEVNAVCFTQSPTLKFYVNNSPTAKLRIVGDSALCIRDTASYRALNGLESSAYRWQLLADGSPTTALETTAGARAVFQVPNPISLIGGTSYSIAVQERDGKCSGPVSRLLLFNSCLQIPNVATPNGDNRNDLFFITNLNQYQANTLDIYNRHGRKVFSETNYANTLDFSGFTAGVYYYYLTVTDKKGTQTFKGWLEVVKP